MVFNWNKIITTGTRSTGHDIMNVSFPIYFNLIYVLIKM